MNTSGTAALGCPAERSPAAKETSSVPQRLLAVDRRIILELVKTSLNQEDVEGLLNTGAPNDEYDSEASLIESNISLSSPNTPLTTARITSIISDVWNQQFGPFTESDLEKRRPAFESVAKKIMQKL